MRIGRFTVSGFDNVGNSFIVLVSQFHIGLQPMLDSGNAMNQPSVHAIVTVVSQGLFMTELNLGRCAFELGRS